MARKTSCLDSPEYEVLVECSSILTDSIKSNMMSISTEMFSKRLLSEEEYEALIDTKLNELPTQKAAKILSAIRSKTRINPRYYKEFVDLLMQQTHLADCVEELTECYQSKLYCSSKSTDSESLGTASFDSSIGATLEQEFYQSLQVQDEAVATSIPSEDSKKVTMRTLVGKLNIKRRVREALEKWASSSKSLDILLTGKTGTGKSTLLNAIIGTKVANEGHSLDPETSEVQCYELKISDVLVKVWDSPGLQDGTEQEEKYRQSIKVRCTNIDLMIYCIQMSETHFSFQDINAMIKLTRTLEASSSVDLWAHSIIVLTFANEVVSLAELNSNIPEEQNKFFFENLRIWRETLTRHLVVDMRLKPKFVEKMAIMPAGIIDEPRLPDPDSNTQKSYWLSELWLKALYKTKLDAQPALIKINAHRMLEVPNEYDKNLKDHENLQDTIPLVFADKGEELGRKLQFGRFGRALGAAFGSSFGTEKSLQLFVDIARASNKIADDDLL